LDMPDRTTAIVTFFELGLLLAGLVLLWRIVLSPTARRQKSPAVLPRWNAPMSDFFLFLWLICGGGFAASISAGTFLKFHPLSPDATIAVATASGQVGVLAGIIIFRLFFDHDKSPSGKPTRNAAVTGLATFLISIPVVAITSLIWQVLLHVCGLPNEKQDLIRMFLDAKSPVLLAVMIFLACIGAPLMEELVFRGGIFRYTRTRLPRWAALLLPACIFGAVHTNLASFAPLVALGVVFSLAYERTGNIKTPMVAHALFNLTSLLLVFTGAET
jgi:membrane protease YdiL (CAAX protease family)